MRRFGKRSRLVFWACALLAALVIGASVASAQTDVLYVVNDKVGIGTSNPTAVMDIVRPTTVPADFQATSGSVRGIFGASDVFGGFRIGSVTGVPVYFIAGNALRMAITAGGYVGIGVTVPSYPLQMASGAYCSVGGTWVSVSSRDAKQEIQELSTETAEDTLEKLTPVTYAYKAAPGEHHVGFIAEDVPDLVATSDHKGMSPMDVVAVLTKVVQEQQKTIAELKAEVGELKKQK